MSKSSNLSTQKKGPESRHLVLPMYTLDSSLVLLPGLIYSVTFTRFRAASLLSRFGPQLDSVPAIKALFAEFDFNPVAGDSTVISKDALEGIQRFNEAEMKHKLQGKNNDSTLESPPEYGGLVLCIAPNMGKISDPQNSSSAVVPTLTISRVVSIVDDTSSIKITFQALRRASKITGVATKRHNEVAVLISRQSTLHNPQFHYQAIVSASKLLFGLIDEFLEKYRDVLKSTARKHDILALSPLANALYVQLAGSSDFAKAYSSLRKILDHWTPSDARDAKVFLRILDLIVAIVPFQNHEKLNVLSCSDVEKRAILVDQMLREITKVFKTLKKNNAMVNHWFHEEATGLQKANLVANQLKSIRVVLDGLSQTSANKDLTSGRGGLPAPKLKTGVKDNSMGKDEDDDELHAITDFIKNKLPKISSISADSKRLLLKDYKRIKSSNPGNADFHVIRNYLEIVTDLPWEKFVSKFDSNKDIELKLARELFDEDHYGLENVKTRLMQYLVVLKLLASNAETEYENLGLRKAEQERQLKNEMERRKFTRESANGETIIIPDNYDSRSTNVDNTLQGGNVPENHENDSDVKNLLASKNNKSPIIMLAGPPGVGKTSLAKSVARVLGRNFQRISLGGVKDESEIRGHRRTYVGAMPGTIIQALRKSQSMNPVILLDEIDKVVGGGANVNKSNGDPAAALLEVLDPEQNTQFIDHYLGFPVDLSQVIFICTANDPYNLSKPLLDRLEMINIGAYDYGEKLVIGSTYLLPRQIRRNGFPEDHLVIIEESVMKKVIIDYTREAGVRNFERKLGTICRFKAVEYSESLSNSESQYDPKVTAYDLSKYLGVPHSSLSSEIMELPVLINKYGVVNGLSYNQDGSGSVLIFECVGFAGEKNGPLLKMTGRLGEVLSESAKIGLTFIKSILYKRLLNTPDGESLMAKFKALEIHLHVPSGAVLKDGPSAGITMALLFLSLLLEKPVPLNIAMTGEITLRGLVLPIGGLKEKILGAHLTGHVDKVIVPRENRRDVIEEYVQKINDPLKLNALLEDNATSLHTNNEPEDYFALKYGVRILYAKEFWDVVKHVWGDELLTRVEETQLSQYHL